MEIQHKDFSLSECAADAREGYRMIWREFHRSCKLPIKRSRISIRRQSDINDSVDHEDNTEVGVSYGYVVMAKICASIGLYINYMTLNVKQGLLPTARFTFFAYGHLFLCSLVSLYLTYILGWEISELLFRDLVDNSHFAIAFLVIGCMTAYLMDGMVTSMYILRQRRFLHDFISNNFIRTPKSFQLRQMVRTFVLIVLLSCMTEPLYLTSSLTDYITQQRFLSNLNGVLFIFVKYSVIWCCLVTSFVACVLTNFIPIFTSFLIANVAKYIESVLSIQLNRISYRNTTDIHNPQLISLLNDYERRLIADFSCYSITMDWPSLDVEGAASPPRNTGQTNSDYMEARRRTSSSTISVQTASVSDLTRITWHRKIAKRKPIVDPSAVKAQAHKLNVRVAFGADALLFAYRSLIKNLYQIKEMIKAYEMRFGYSHLVQIYITGLITAQWVVFGLLQIRGSESRDTRSNIELTLPDLNKTYVFRAVISVITFIASNTYIFARADRLPRQMTKMESQLFMFNIELIRRATEDQQRSKIQSHIEAHDWPELEQVWLLYDQAVRISHKVRFRLGSSLIYEKNCLVQILFGEVSAILIIIQLVDLYKFS